MLKDGFKKTPNNGVNYSYWCFQSDSNTRPYA